MLPVLFAVSVATLAAAPAPRHAYEPGLVERYDLSMTANLRHGGPNAAPESFDVEATLTLRISAAASAGERTGTLTLDGFTVTDSGAVRIARAPGLPAGLLTVPVTVRRDGRIVAAQTLLLVTDRQRGPWVARVSTDAHGLLPAPGGRGLRASRLLSFESRSGRPILPPPETPPEDGSLGAEQTAVPLLPADGLALIAVPPDAWKVGASQHDRIGLLKLTSTVSARSDRRTALSVAIAPPKATARATRPSPRGGRDGALQVPHREVNAAGRRPGLSLAGELSATFDGGRRTLSGLDAALERVETLESSPPRHISLAIRLRRQR
jgi:hypothetical protein